MAIDAQALADSLHIDADSTELATLNDLIVTATELVKDSVAYSQLDNFTPDQLSAVPLFESAVKALATALYYDRTLSNGMPKAVDIMIVHLQGRLWGF
ncbi:head-tail connector protein [Leuconostoc citreum]|uniref:head-tail connector protein n=1 Tax=Leuconostoc citreum TaxID=33964 RepID=UPI00200AC020|nr:head-tail connector protein [Leuconostoc citreum]MCK8606162.1 head-tail connector protein [Leuconostoc citreum]